jgi:hypothetical protein
MHPGLLESMGRFDSRWLPNATFHVCCTQKALAQPQSGGHCVGTEGYSECNENVEKKFLQENPKERGFARSKILRFQFLVYDQCSCRKMRLYLYSWSSGCFPRPLPGLFCTWSSLALTCHAIGGVSRNLIRLSARTGPSAQFLAVANQKAV